MNHFTLKDLWIKNGKCLEDAGIENGMTEAEYFVAEAAKMSDSEFLLHASEICASESVSHLVNANVLRRLKGEPWQYILGHAPFRRLDLFVGPGCLIPRPETEFMLDYVLPRIPKGGTVCELGVGSGAISLAIATERPDTTVVGVEISPDALKWAELNLSALNIRNVCFLMGNLYGPLAENKQFDCIVANLPYIPDCQKQMLPVNVRDYEPELALFGGKDGTDLLVPAIYGARRYLHSDGFFCFETDTEHVGFLKEKADEVYPSVEILKDQYGKERFLTGCKSVRK